jgi:hypothetical protein
MDVSVEARPARPPRGPRPRRAYVQAFVPTGRGRTPPGAPSLSQASARAASAARSSGSDPVHTRVHPRPRNRQPARSRQLRAAHVAGDRRVLVEGNARGRSSDPRPPRDAVIEELVEIAGLIET